MYKIIQAENKDVDLLLDMKLDIIFNSKEVLDLDKNEMEKIVNYSEEEIRDNLSEYKLVIYNENVVATYALANYGDGKLIDTLYVDRKYRNMGIGTKIINKILISNYETIYLWVYKSNEKAINLYKRLGFEIKDETETKFLMENKNIKEENHIIKAMLFNKEVKQLAEKYDLEYFFATERTYSAKVKCCSTVKDINDWYYTYSQKNNVISNCNNEDENVII